MANDLDPLQRLVLLRLAVSTDGGEFMKDLESTLPKKRRESLEKTKLIEVSQRQPEGSKRKATFLCLTDAGWAWCDEHLPDAVRIGGPPTKLALVVLSRTLGIMKRYLQSQEHTTSLGQLVLQAKSPEAPAAQAVLPGTQVPDVAQQIRTACRDLGNGKGPDRIRIAQLRTRLASVTREHLDRALLQLEQEGSVTLYPLDDPREISAEDRAAVLRTPSGSERHLVYFGRAS